MPAELVAKIEKSDTFNKGYDTTELLAAAELDMQWHTLPASAPLQNPDAFETEALEKTHLLISYVPPRYRSSYFSHIWGSGYAASIMPIFGHRCSTTMLTHGSKSTVA